MNKLRMTSNLKMLEFVARKLGELKDQFVFLGGCTTDLFITDMINPYARITLDVDCIIDAISLPQYHKIEHKLEQKGFKKSLEDDVICRWRHGEIILDVMPTNEKILGFGNRWYKSAIEHAIEYQIENDLTIKAVTAPYFLATKLEAFKGRGKSDYFASHDMEDIITVIDGRAEVADEIQLSEVEVKQYLADAFKELLQNTNFLIAISGHLNNHGSLADSRKEIVIRRMQKIANCC